MSIKFRYYHKDHWHYWGFIDNNSFQGIGTCSISPSMSITEIEKLSCQCSPYKDRGNTDIYVGDICKNSTLKGEVVFDEGCFSLKIIDIYKRGTGYDMDTCPPLYDVLPLKIVGNIYVKGNKP